MPSTNYDHLRRTFFRGSNIRNDDEPGRISDEEYLFFAQAFKDGVTVSDLRYPPGPVGLVQNGVGSTSSAEDITVSLPLFPEIGNLLVLFCWVDAGTPDDPEGWDLVDTVSGTSTTLKSWIKIVDGGDTDEIQVDNSTVSTIASSVFELELTDGTDPLVDSAKAFSNSATSLEVGPVNIESRGMVVGCWGRDSTSDFWSEGDNPTDMLAVSPVPLLMTAFYKQGSSTTPFSSIADHTGSAIEMVGLLLSIRVPAFIYGDGGLISE